MSDTTKDTASLASSEAVPVTETQDAPYRVEVDKGGCERCSHGQMWTIVEWTLDNIYTIARRELRRLERLAYTDEERDGWRHVLRLCEKAGCQGRGVLRDNGGVKAMKLTRKQKIDQTNPSNSST